MKLLDCTLRDGGYVNDWKFGFKEINSAIRCLERANLNIIEVGFMKPEPYIAERSVYNSMSQVEALLKNKKEGCIYSVMTEGEEFYPINLLEPAKKNSADMIRVCMWKTRQDKEGKVYDALLQGYEYGKKVIEKGYKLGVQLIRTMDLYTEDEFINVIKMFNSLHPYAIYIVDTWGNHYSNTVIKYMHLADQYLTDGIAIGCHLHNNMQQAFSTAEKVMNEKFDHEIIIDSSVFGIGRFCGNLATELIVKYSNDNFNTDYDLESIIQVYDDCVKAVNEKYKWGYSIPFLSTSVFDCNPRYLDFYVNELKLSPLAIHKAFSLFEPEDKIMFSQNSAERYYTKAIIE